MDTISTSATIAFAMECFERGLNSLEDTGGLELRFGNTGAMLQAVEWIARRQGFGDLLADGSLRAAQKIGGNALDYAIQVKGQELNEFLIPLAIPISEVWLAVMNGEEMNLAEAWIAPGDKVELYSPMNRGSLI